MPLGRGKHCFVTVGATAGFKPLIDEVISDGFVSRLVALGFSQLTVQCGPHLAYFEGKKQPKPLRVPLGITGLDYTDRIGDYMARCAAGVDEKGEERIQGLIICHAGTGSILDALNYHAKVIAVPNPALMDNHQQELAEQMEAEGYLVHGKLGHLDEALQKTIQYVPAQWPPFHEQRRYIGGLLGITMEAWCLAEKPLQRVISIFNSAGLQLGPSFSGAEERCNLPKSNWVHYVLTDEKQLRNNMV